MEWNGKPRFPVPFHTSIQQRQSEALDRIACYVAKTFHFQGLVKIRPDRVKSAKVADMNFKPN